MTSLLNSTFVTQLTGGYNPYISPYLFETSIRYSSLAFLVGCIFALCLILIVNGGNDKYKFPSYKIFLYVIIASGVCFGLGMGFYYTWVWKNETIVSWMRKFSSFGVVLGLLVSYFISIILFFQKNPSKTKNSKKYILSIESWIRFGDLLFPWFLVILMFATVGNYFENTYYGKPVEIDALVDIVKKYLPYLYIDGEDVCYFPIFFLVAALSLLGIIIVLTTTVILKFKRVNTTGFNLSLILIWYGLQTLTVTLLLNDFFTVAILQNYILLSISLALGISLLSFRIYLNKKNGPVILPSKPNKKDKPKKKAKK